MPAKSFPLVFPPAFSEAMLQYVRISERLGDDHPEVMKALTKALSLSPDWFRDEMYAKAKKMGLIPEPVGYLDNGDPVYSLESVAKAHGISIEEAEQSMDEMLSDRAELGLSSEVITDHSLVNRRQ